MEKIKCKLNLVCSVAVLAFLFYSSPSAAVYEYCYLTPDATTLCLLDVPDDPKIVLRKSAVDISTLDYKIMASPKDTKQCKEAKGRLGKLRTGAILCVTEKNKAFVKKRAR